MMKLGLVSSTVIQPFLNNAVKGFTPLPDCREPLSRQSPIGRRQLIERWLPDGSHRPKNRGNRRVVLLVPEEREVAVGRAHAATIRASPATLLFLAKTPSTWFHNSPNVFPHELPCGKGGLPVSGSGPAESVGSFCRHPAGAQLDFADTLSHGFTPVATGLSPPAGAWEENNAQPLVTSFSPQAYRIPNIFSKHRSVLQRLSGRDSA